MRVRSPFVIGLRKHENFDSNNECLYMCMVLMRKYEAHLSPNILGVGWSRWILAFPMFAEGGEKEKALAYSKEWKYLKINNSWERS